MGDGAEANHSWLAFSLDADSATHTATATASILPNNNLFNPAILGR
jgi:hypothetical protein